MVSRYADRAERVAREFGPGHAGPEALAGAIVKEMQEQVRRDTEWCAVLLEEYIHSFSPDTKPAVSALNVVEALHKLAASFRARGQEL